MDHHSLKCISKTDSYQGTYPKDRLINYLNTYSVEALEYAAPHYKLKGTFYTVYTYTRGTFITEYEVTATYNTNYSLGSLIHASQSSPAIPIYVCGYKGCTR